MNDLGAADRRKHVEPELGDARLARQWSAIETGLERKRFSPIWAAFGVGAALAVAALLFAIRPTSDDAPVALHVGETATTAAEARDLVVEEETQIALAPSSEIAVVTEQPTAVQVQLRRGRAHFDVARRRERRFSIDAGNVEVTVIGTAFTVDRRDQTVRVDVERGIVEVRAANGETRRLTAGEHWDAPRVATSASERPEPPQTAQNDPTPPIEPPVEPTVEPTHEDPPQRHPVRPTPPEVPAVDPADAFFEQANQARTDNDARRAAELYEQLVDRHPSDRRAGLAAFELGRLRMNRLGDREGAVRAFERSLALGTSHREDAMAHLVTLQRGLGNAAACRAARDAYLASFPAGAHAAAVRDGCP